jgi:acyl carrier protein
LSPIGADPPTEIESLGEHSIESLKELIVEFLREELSDLSDDFDTKSDLVEAGLSSLLAVQLLLAIEERTGIWVDESELTPENLASVEALARCVHGHVSS